MAVAPPVVMTFKTKLVVIGSMIGGGLLFGIWSRRARRRGAGAPALLAAGGTGEQPDTIGQARDGGAGELAIPPGISQVDPQPLTYLTEAVDPDAIRAAHDDIIEQRERLPVAGKNLP